MRCFSCFKLSKETRDSKKSWKCWKGSPKEGAEEESRRRKGRGICCFCGGKSSKDEEPLTKKRGSCCCFCVESSKDREPLRKRKKWCIGYFCCNGSTKDEELPKKEGNKKMCCCFSCNKRSLEEPSRKKEKNGMFCFSSNKEHSSDESLRREGECCISCFCCCKSSKKEALRGGEGAATNGFPHAKSTEKKTGCVPCFKSSKKEQGIKRGERPTTKPPKAKSSKWSIINIFSCLRCRTCCSKKANRKSKKPSRKKILCWKKKGKRVQNHLGSLAKSISFESESDKHRSAAEEILRIGNGITEARVFTFAELAAATQNFMPENQLGEGGFGRIYQGQLEDTKQLIAVKQLDRHGNQGNKEFLTEVLMLSLLNHQNVVNLLGYCAEGYEKLIVYEYMPLGSLQDHLFDLSPRTKPLDWITRMKIAAGVAKGLQYLHEIANPPVIHRDLKASNILLDEEFNSKLSDLGISKLGPVGDKNHVSTRVMGTCGYYAPEYALTGQLTTRSDIYSFGVVLLELITGRKAMDPSRPRNERMLVDWALPLFNDKQRFVQIADPLLEGNFPIRALYQALVVTTMCIEAEDTKRPQIKDVVSALDYLTSQSCEIPVNPQPPQYSGRPDSHVRSSSDESTQSSYSDWQSCSTIREDEDDMIVITL